FPSLTSQRRHKRRTATKTSGCKCLILMVEQRGIEPLTSALRTRRSAKLSYCPTRSAILGVVVESVKDRSWRARRQITLPDVFCFYRLEVAKKKAIAERARGHRLISQRSSHHLARGRVCRRRGRRAWCRLRALMCSSRRQRPQN